MSERYRYSFDAEIIKSGKNAKVNRDAVVVMNDDFVIALPVSRESAIALGRHLYQDVTVTITIKLKDLDES